jgi:hypothetical protein
LNLSVCFLTDENCRDLAQLVNLERLCLARTRVSGDAVAPIVKACVKLQYLDLGGFKFVRKDCVSFLFVLFL